MYSLQAAEHASAIVFAAKNRLDISLGVAVGSSIQIALFVTPFCVLVGWTMGQPLDLNFQVFETVVVFLTVLISVVVNMEGRCSCCGVERAVRSKRVPVLPPYAPSRPSLSIATESSAGRSNWLQGILLIMAYLVVAASFLLHNPDGNKAG